MDILTRGHFVKGRNSGDLSSEDILERTLLAEFTQTENNGGVDVELKFVIKLSILST